MRLKKGDDLKKLNLPSVSGKNFKLSDIRGRKSLISFYRFAQCPFCNLRIHELIKRHDEFMGDLKIVAIFDAPLDHLIKSMERHEAPFEILADEDFSYFRAIDVEKSLIKFLIGSVFNIHRLVQASLKGFIPLSFKGSMLTVPVDILINEKGVVERVYYGKTTADHMNFDDILAFART
ncbi:MAG: hypothetical protein CMM79_03705 [Rhodospirillaceae bacterium]|nr:hypothetical protein [Rhodospirillaceae bacterium]